LSPSNTGGATFEKLDSESISQVPQEESSGYQLKFSVLNKNGKMQRRNVKERILLQSCLFH
jgi:hypothetical protein